jgi:hypothetical protein
MKDYLGNELNVGDKVSFKFKRNYPKFKYHGKIINIKDDGCLIKFWNPYIFTGASYGSMTSVWILDNNLIKVFA